MEGGKDGSVSMCITAHTVIYRNNRFRYPLTIYRSSEQERKGVKYVWMVFARLIILYNYILGSHNPLYYSAVI